MEKSSFAKSKVEEHGKESKEERKGCAWVSLISNGATRVDYQPARVSRPVEFTAERKGKKERKREKGREGQSGGRDEEICKL